MDNSNWEDTSPAELIEDNSNGLLVLSDSVAITDKVIDVVHHQSSMHFFVITLEKPLSQNMIYYMS